MHSLPNKFLSQGFQAIFSLVKSCYVSVTTDPMVSPLLVGIISSEVNEPIIPGPLSLRKNCARRETAWERGYPLSVSEIMTNFSGFKHVRRSA